ncbi:hypothetical protein ACFPVX_22885 [Cohnella faecalis]|uniref:Uncharacterized protein n=1 Tax=Cohnella faecalis TaxID=2315694 RepID=A0A398CI16_9BACL|nr:hypothetical protein [Cohnella faecalis]RIE02433.1 hypothetical protein D3H35_17160 [Cohnella faecalis]
MTQPLPPGATLPLTFAPGDALTADSLNRLQTELLSRILSHSHAGNTETDQEGVVLGSSSLADGSVEARHLAPNAVPPEAIPDRSVTRAKLAESLHELLAHLEHQTRHLREHIFRLESDMDEAKEAVYRENDRIALLNERLELALVIAEDARLKEQEDELRIENMENQIVHRDERFAKMEGAVAALTESFERAERDAERSRRDSDERLARIERGFNGLQERFDRLEATTTVQIAELVEHAERDEATDIAFRESVGEMVDRLVRTPLPTTWGYFRNYQDIVSYEEEYTQNIDAADIVSGADGETVELRFVRPYADKYYTVLITPEQRGVHALPTAVPVILHRDAETVRFGFWDGYRWHARNGAWNIAIFGLLA